MLGYDEMVAIEGNTACGLRNLGNACYANALINSFAKLPSCRQWFGKHQSNAVADSAHDPVCTLCALAGDVALLTVVDVNEPFAPEIVRRRASWDALCTLPTPRSTTPVKLLTLCCSHAMRSISATSKVLILQSESAMFRRRPLPRPTGRSLHPA